jgi:tetratricopeptide (TPR) repeat protein
MFSPETKGKAPRKPIICWVDNAHQGSEALRLCRSIISSDYVQSIPILFIITKNEDLTDRPQERIQIAALKNHHRCSSLQISRISNEEHRQICSSFLDFSPPLLDELCRQTQGNPLYAKETIAEWIRQQILVYSPQGFILKEGTPFTVPKSIRNIWRTRIAAATKNFEQSMFGMAELAGMLGIHVYMKEWLALDPNYPEEKRRYIVDMLQTHRLAHRWKNGTGWSFQHPLIPKLFIKNAEKFQREKSGHLRIVEMLKSYKRVDTFERIGFHLLSAGVLDEGLKQTLLGIKLRTRRCEQDQALELLELYEKHLRKAQISQSDERWGEIWTLRFEIAYEIQNQEIVESLKAKLRKNLVRYHWPKTQSYFLAIEGQELLSAGLSNEAKCLFEHGSNLAQEAGDKQCFYRHQRGLVQYYQRIGNIQEARHLLSKLSKEAKSSRDRYLQGMCALYESMLELQSNNLERAERILQQTVQHFLKYKLVRYASEGINMLGDVHRKNGQFQKAERYYMNAIMKMEQINHPELIIPQLNLSILRLEKGEFSQIRAELVRTIPDLEANNKNTLALFARVILLVAQVNLQEVTFAKENLNQISSLLKQTSLFEFDIAVLLNKAATCISKDEKKSLKLRILRLVKEQYIGLNRPEEVQGIEQRINILRTDQTR